MPSCQVYATLPCRLLLPAEDCLSGTIHRQVRGRPRAASTPRPYDLDRRPCGSGAVTVIEAACAVRLAPDSAVRDGEASWRLSSSGERRAGIVVGMSIVQPDPVPGVQGRSPRAIRLSLLPEEAGDFDREYRQVMREAMETLDLTPVLEMLERWDRVASLSRDPERHRRMLDRAERLQRGEDLPMEPWSAMKARLGL